MKVIECKLDLIQEGERARIEYGDIEELAESIKEHGVIQPISVVEQGALFRILAGGRRYRAAKLAGLESIPAIVRAELKESSSLEIELVENVHRKDFDWVERCQLEERIYKLKEKEDSNWSQRKTANLLGRARSALSQDLELAGAIKVIPELAEADTQSDAWKKWVHIKDDAAVKTIVRQQEEKAEQIVDTEKPVAPEARKKFTSFRQYIETKYIVKDCFEGMKNVGSGIVDFVEVDPPYAVDLAAHRKKAQDQHIVSTYNELDEANYPKFLCKLSKELFRIMKANSYGILWYGSKWYPQVIRALEKAGFKITLTPAIWIKSGGGYSPNPKIQLANLYENFIVFRKGLPTLAREGRANVFQFGQPSSKERIHPTERPILLMQELLEIFTNESCIICVPFLGSGVTLRAAYNLNRVAFGYDMDGTYRDRLIAKEVQDEDLYSSD